MSVLINLVLPLCGMAVAPFLLIASQKPKGPGDAPGLDFSDHKGAAALPPPPADSLPMRDGTALPARIRRAARAEAPVLLLLHGSSFHGLQFEGLAAALTADGAAHCVAVDLRGHGYAPARRGDVDHIGQMEEDVADAIAALRDMFPGAKLVLGGHSSGGGLAVRHAGGGWPKPDAYLLLAPFLGHRAPSSRPHAGGWARPLVRRIIGLSMLNAAGIRRFNGLTTLEFATDPAVMASPLGATVTGSYSYRLMISYAPRADLKADLRGLSAPTLLLVGDGDEAFRPEAYAPLLAESAPHAQVEILPGAGHLGLVDAPAAAARIAAFLRGI